MNELDAFEKWYNRLKEPVGTCQVGDYLAFKMTHREYKERMKLAWQAARRDMRHACAEAVVGIAPSYLDGDDVYIEMNEAHRRIMNVGGKP